MANFSSNSFTKKIVTVVVSVEKPMSSSEPILGLLKSSYPKLKTEIFFIGKADYLKNDEVIKKLRNGFMVVKTVTSSSEGTIYSQMAPLVRGEVCLFTSMECSPERDWIKKNAEMFIKGGSVGMVLGEVQYRNIDSHNKIETYCEQIGLGSVGSMIDEEAGGPVFANKTVILDRESVDRVALVLRPINLAVSRSFLLVFAKNSRNPKGFTVQDLVKNLMDEKLKIFYNSAALVEWFHPMDVKELKREMLNRVYQNTAWIKVCPKRLKVQIRFWGNHELSFPFWVSIDVSLGDFHWMNLLGLVIGVKYLIWCFQKLPGQTFWYTDEVLLLESGFGFFLLRYFLPVLKIQPWSDFILWCWIRYRTNMSMFLSGFGAGIKFKCFYWAESW